MKSAKSQGNVVLDMQDIILKKVQMIWERYLVCWKSDSLFSVSKGRRFRTESFARIQLEIPVKLQWVKLIRQNTFLSQMH
jgi:hypothetical protein